MPSIDLTFLKQLKKDFSQFPCFVETGTYLGETIFAMERYFQKLYTIEYSDHYFQQTKGLYKGNKIEFILGDSSKVFSWLLQDIHENCIFFLDGHWSGGNTGKSEKDCPLVEEITHINRFFSKEAILIIDDVRLFGTRSLKGEDWSNINANDLIRILGERVTDVYYLDSITSKNDRLVIHIKKNGL